MVRQVSPKRTPGWKAALAVSVVAGAILWHLLACTESPMAFSPSGEDLAFVTMEPYREYRKGEDIAIAGVHAFRLMVLSKGKTLRMIEQSTSHMLAAPAYSPDGKRLAYLRIPLLTVEQKQRMVEGIQKRKEKFDEAIFVPMDEAWPSGPAEGATTAPADVPKASTEDLTLPAMEALTGLLGMATVPTAPAELVVRDVDTGRIVSAVQVRFHVMDMGDKDLEGGVLMSYLLTRLQFGPEGKWVFVCSRNFVTAVNPATREENILAAAVWAAVPSPDGKTVAVLQPRAVGFIRTDGSKATYVRWDKEPSRAGLAWVDDKTLAILRAGDGGDRAGKQAVLDFVTTDGQMLPAKTLPIAGQGDQEESGQLAVAPDGKHMVVSFGSSVHFMRSDGKVLKSWKHDSDLLVQPTFTPDSKTLAFKYMLEDEGRASAVVFFTPAGKELSRVKIPQIPPGTTRPVTQPTTEPAEED